LSASSQAESKSKRSALTAFNQLTNHWITAARMLQPVIAMVKHRKTQPWYTTKVRITRPRSGKRQATVDDDDINVNRMHDDAVVDIDFRV
jgi:hypothetical protein